MALRIALMSLLGLTLAARSIAAPPPSPEKGEKSDEKKLASFGTAPLVAKGAESCPSDMVEVEGDYCPTVEQICTQFVKGQEKRDRCIEYRPTARCYGKPERRHFCIDRYEFPNLRGLKPVVGVTWEESRDFCGAIGKRLCKDREWTLACEGQERFPYPYGFKRDSQACNIDREYIMPNNDAYGDPKLRAAEIARVDQRDNSGARESCRSPFGVQDMTGNVDEWVQNEKGTIKETPYVSGLKGGYWGPVRNRCRPMTTDHNIWHSGYQIGFRCCGEVGRTSGPRPLLQANGAGIKQAR